MAIDSRFAGPIPLGHFGASLAPSSASVTRRV
jgi:hypothetical protein